MASAPIVLVPGFWLGAWAWDDVAAALRELDVSAKAREAFVMELLREREMTGVKVVVGGIIPDEDARELQILGVARVFQPGASLESIVSGVREAVAEVQNGK